MSLSESSKMWFSKVCAETAGRTMWVHMVLEVVAISAKTVRVGCIWS